MHRIRQRGVTALELLLTVGIAAIALSIGVPGVQGFVLDARQTTSVNDMVATMHYARSEAVDQNSLITVCASQDGRQCTLTPWERGWLVYVDADADRSVDAGERVLRVFGPYPGIRIAAALPGYFQYRPNGRLMVATPEEATAELTFCDARGAAHARVVIVPVSGRPLAGPRRRDGHPPVCG